MLCYIFGRFFYNNSDFIGFISFQSIGLILFGILDVKLGLFWTRMLGNLMTTVGLVLLTFYRESGYYIMACFWLISAPAVYYTTSNLSIVRFFPKISGFLLILLPSICDMSSGLFLLFKLAYENLNYDLVIMLQILAACTSLVWLRALARTIRSRFLLYKLCTKNDF